MKKIAILAAVIVLFFGVAPASAVGLTDSDFAYLAAQDVKKESPILQKLSPKELARLHSLIVDPKTDSDPSAKAKAVRDALNEFERNQDWEQANPGRLWDDPKRDRPRLN